jgi:biotin transport system substrate-specific component
LLGARRGSLALALYLLEGALGAPVFAPGGAPGIARFFGPTGGYLLAYPIAAGVVGLLAERGWDTKLWRAALAMLAGNTLIYVGGVTWLAVFLGDLQLALVNGFVPFIVADLLKIALAAIALPGGWALLRRYR